MKIFRKKPNLPTYEAVKTQEKIENQQEKRMEKFFSFVEKKFQYDSNTSLLRDNLEELSKLTDEQLQIIAENYADCRDMGTGHIVLDSKIVKEYKDTTLYKAKVFSLRKLTIGENPIAEEFVLAQNEDGKRILGAVFVNEHFGNNDFYVLNQFYFSGYFGSALHEARDCYECYMKCDNLSILLNAETGETKYLGKIKESIQNEKQKLLKSNDGHAYLKFRNFFNLDGTPNEKNPELVQIFSDKEYVLGLDPDQDIKNEDKRYHYVDFNERFTAEDFFYKNDNGSLFVRTKLRNSYASFGGDNSCNEIDCNICKGETGYYLCLEVGRLAQIYNYCEPLTGKVVYNEFLDAYGNKLEVVEERNFTKDKETQQEI